MCLVESVEDSKPFTVLLNGIYYYNYGIFMFCRDAGIEDES